MTPELNDLIRSMVHQIELDMDKFWVCPSCGYDKTTILSEVCHGCKRENFELLVSDDTR